MTNKDKILRKGIFKKNSIALLQEDKYLVGFYLSKCLLYIQIKKRQIQKKHFCEPLFEMVFDLQISQIEEERMVRSLKKEKIGDSCKERKKKRVV